MSLLVETTGQDDEPVVLDGVQDVAELKCVLVAVTSLVSVAVVVIIRG